MIDEEFSLLKILGKGGSSKVFLAQDTQGARYALKAIRKDKNYASQTAAGMVEREHELLSKLDLHPNIIKSHMMNLNGILEAKGESEPVMYNVLEYAKHGALSNFIRYTGGVEESLARLFSLQICNAVHYIHSIGYAHLDIKLENILLDHYYNIKVADMGSSHFVAESDGLSDKRRGTMMYMPPEVMNLKPGQAFDAKAADIYSLGITIFVMFIGEFPVFHKNSGSMSTNDSSNRSSDDMKVEGGRSIQIEGDILPDCVKQLIEAMTYEDPLMRPNIDEVLASEWLSQNFSNNILEDVYSEMSSRKEYMLKSPK